MEYDSSSIVVTVLVIILIVLLLLVIVGSVIYWIRHKRQPNIVDEDSLDCVNQLQSQMTKFYDVMRSFFAGLYKFTKNQNPSFTNMVPQYFQQLTNVTQTMNVSPEFKQLLNQQANVLLAWQAANGSAYVDTGVSVANDTWWNNMGTYIAAHSPNGSFQVDSWNRLKNDVDKLWYGWVQQMMTDGTDKRSATRGISILMANFASMVCAIA
jgi:hypothetical protein